MALREILTSQGVVPEQWEASVNEEYLRDQFWSRWMGTSDNALIQLNEDLGKGPGDAINTSIRSQISGGVITGNVKTTGNEGSMQFYNFRMTVDDDKVAVKYENIPLSQQRVAFGIIESMRSGLKDKRQLRHDDRITAALSDVSIGRVRGRYQYGKLDSNWNATHATALGNVDNTDDKVTIDTIGKLTRKAEILGGNATAKIRPYKVMVGDGIQRWYVLVLHTYCARDLTKDDPAWKNPMLLLPAMAPQNSPLYTGSSFLGGYEGVLIYRWEGVQVLPDAGNGSIDVAHNLFMGAQAAVVAWAQHGKITEEVSNYGKDLGLEHHEINGISKVVYDRATEDGSTNEDNAVIHYFAAAEPDA